MLLYVLDMSCSDGRDPISDFISLQKELQLYNPILLQRPSMIFANKMDKKVKQSKLYLQQLTQLTSLPIVSGSCLKNTNLHVLIRSLFDYLRDLEIQRIKQMEQQLKETQEKLQNMSENKMTQKN
jgi:GTP-binding protein